MFLLSLLAASAVAHPIIRRHNVQYKLEKGMVLPETQFVESRQDHFDATNTKTYKQRFWVNDTFWNKTGPVFIYIEGEGTGSGAAAVTGHTAELAQAFGALLFVVEHRYYGASVPVPDFTTANMRFLSSHQALADLAAFVPWASAKYGIQRSSRWFSFGGSYAGAMSSWFRLKYPNLIFGSISTSGPVQAKTNFEDYNNVVHNSFASTIVGGSTACQQRVENAFAEIGSLLESPTGRSTLATYFHTLPSITTANAEDTETFLETIAGNLQGMVQYNPAVSSPDRMDIRLACEILLANRTAIGGMAYLQSAWFGSHPIDIDTASSLTSLLNTTYDPNERGVGDRQWIYQTCTEFGYYQTCDRNSSCPFVHGSMTLEQSLKLCGLAFNVSGEDVWRSVERSNAFYGADRPASSRVMFVNGDVDPWHALSVTRTLSATQPAVFIRGTSHCADMAASHPTDPAPLREARLAIKAQLAAWIAEA